MTVRVYNMSCIIILELTLKIRDSFATTLQPEHLNIYVQPKALS